MNVPNPRSVSPLRWVTATVVPVLVVTWGHNRSSLSTSGALLALIVGFILSLAHYSFFLSLIAFFVSSSKATKFKQEVKRGYEGDFKEGGQRNWLQVLCNGGMALELSLLYLLDLGSADLPVDFRWVSDIKHYAVLQCSSPSAGTTTAAAGWAWRCWGRSPAAMATPGPASLADPFLITIFHTVLHYGAR